MSGLVNGKWVETMPAAEEIKDGKFVHLESAFRDVISPAEFPGRGGALSSLGRL